MHAHTRAHTHTCIHKVGETTGLNAGDVYFSFTQSPKLMTLVRWLWWVALPSDGAGTQAASTMWLWHLVASVLPWCHPAGMWKDGAEEPVWRVLVAVPESGIIPLTSSAARSSHVAGCEGGQGVQRSLHSVSVSTARCSTLDRDGVFNQTKVSKILQYLLKFFYFVPSHSIFFAF